MKNFIFAVAFVFSFSVTGFAQSAGFSPTAESLMANQVGFNLIYNSDGNGGRTENAIGGGYLATYSAKAGKLNFTLFNVGSIEESSVTPVGGRQFTEEFEVRVPLDLNVPFSGDNSTVYLHGGSQFRWQSGGSQFASKFTASPGFGVGFKVPSPMGATYTSYTFVPRINDANSLQEHRVAFEVYKPFGNNENYSFFTRTTASTGRFNPLPTAINFNSDPVSYYNVKIAVGVSRRY